MEFFLYDSWLCLTSIINWCSVMAWSPQEEMKMCRIVPGIKTRHIPGNFLNYSFNSQNNKYLVLGWILDELRLSEHRGSLHHSHTVCSVSGSAQYFGCIKIWTASGRMKCSNWLFHMLSAHLFSAQSIILTLETLLQSCVLQHEDSGGMTGSLTGDAMLKCWIRALVCCLR